MLPLVTELFLQVYTLLCVSNMKLTALRTAISVQGSILHYHSGTTPHLNC